MKGFLSIALLAMLVAASSVSCRESHDEGGPERRTAAAPRPTGPGSTVEDPERPATGSVSLAGVRGVAIATVGAPSEEGIWHPAEARADESERAALSAPAAGIVTRIYVAPGREVPAGTPLLAIRSPEVAELSAAWLARHARRQQAAADLAREERLARAAAGAARELEAARAALAVADAEEQAARLALESRGVPAGRAASTVTIRAPRRGRVAAYTVLAGQGVEGRQDLGTFEVGRGALVAVELALPGPAGWEPGARAAVRRSDGKAWTAVVEGLPTSLSTTTRRLGYRLRLLGDDLPYPGTPLEVRVPLPRGVVVPQGAVQQVEGTWGVFVVTGEIARFQPVRLGPDLGSAVIVLEGLAPGERIATEGAYLLKSKRSKGAGEGDEHGD
jgi:cobalt-zinc-cadmium efflux system membrane fusion protein